ALSIEGGELAADKRIIEVMKDVLTHLLRNAIDHGIEGKDERRGAGKPASAAIRLAAWRDASQIVIEVADDGRGLDTEAIRRAALRQSLASEAELAAMAPEQIHPLIFAPGLSTARFVTDTSGRGVGMDAVRASIESIKGSIELVSRPGAGLAVRMRLPLTLTTARVLIVKCEEHLFALPIEQVRNAMFVAPGELFSIEGRQMLELGGDVLPVASLARLLELPPPDGAPGRTPAHMACVVVAVGGQALGLLVDELVCEDEVVLRMQDGLLRRVRNVFCSTLLENGEVCPVLNPGDLLKTAQHGGATAQAAAPPADIPAAVRRRVLLVEDSLTTRTQEKRILEAAGYEVVTAVDGIDGYAKLGQADFDIVVSDINMPNLDGLALTELIRRDKRHHDLPVVLVTSLSSEEDRRRGMEVGADAYIAKPAFDQRMLLESLQRLL
ncbi:MAG: response regulator, partial [Zoogloea sp.]|nr:response regulator [Zoogloea sp.]